MKYRNQTIIIDRSVPAIQAWRDLPDGIRAEVIDNKLYVLSPATPYHARSTGRLFNALTNYVVEYDLGEVFTHSVGVFVKGKDTVVEPDISFFSKEKLLVLERDGIHTVPDLVIEVLSTNRKHDLVTKKGLYEKTGVQEYWVVDPNTKNATGYTLKDAVYGEPLLMNSEIYVRIFNRTFKF